MATRNVPLDAPTIHAAVQASDVEGGDIVTVDPGTYNETISLIASSGGWLIPVTIRASDPNNKPVITSTGAIQCVLGNSIMKGTSSGLPVFEDLIFDGWDAAANGVFNFVADGTLRGCALQVTRCEFIDCAGQRCVRLVGTVAITSIVEECRFENCGDSGNAIVARGSDDTIIRNNLFFPATDAPCESGAFTSNTYVLQNSVYGAYDGGAVNVMSGAGFYDNNVIQNTGTGAAIGIDTTGTYTDNLVFGAFTTDYAGTDGGGNDTGLDPEYRDPVAGDLTTPDSSPCYRTAARSASALLTYTGASRSDPTDKGAYEEPDALPDFTSATMTGPLTIRCVWTEAMLDNAALVLATNYAITGGVTPTLVTRINATTVDLTLAVRLPLANATVTSSGPQDLAGQAAAGASAAFAVPYLTMVPPWAVDATAKIITGSFNLAPTSGVSAVTDWSVLADAGAVVSVQSVAVDSAAVTLTVWPGLTIGIPYTVTPINAANAQGPVG